MEQAQLLALNGQDGDGFGYSVAMVGDTAFIGAYNEDDGANSAGSVYIFTLENNSWSQNSKLIGSGLDIHDKFGWQLDIDGGTAVIGAYGDDDGGTNAGAAYIFERNAITWTQAAKVTATNGAALDYFGFDVAVEDNLVLVGAHYHDGDGVENTGTAYVFSKLNGVWQETDHILPIDAVHTDYFGRKVAINDQTLLISAHSDDDMGGGSGSVYVYESTAGQPLTTTTIITYTYDPTYRLTEATYRGAVWADYRYIYDAVGNMTAFTETVGTDITRVDRSFNPANQLQTAFNHEKGTTSFTFDAVGNLTEMMPPGTSGANPAGTTRYHFDQRNRLISSTLNIEGQGWVKQVEYVYDGANNRLQQIAHSETDTMTTTYTNDVYGLSQVLISDDGTTQTSIIFGQDLIYQDSGKNLRYLLADSLGSVRTELVDSAIQSTTTYEPYGKVLTAAGKNGTTYTFTGEEFDAASSLIYLRARYYNPHLKIFLSHDPFPGFTDLSASQHGYIYVHNNPVNLTDPTGEFPHLLLLAGAGALIGGTAAGIIYALTHQGEALFHSRDFWRAVGAGAAGGALAGLLSPLWGGLLGGGFGGLLLYGAIDGVIGGVAEQLTLNLLTPCANWHDYLAQAAFYGAVGGAATMGAFHGAGQFINRIGQYADNGLSRAINWFNDKFPPEVVHAHTDGNLLLSIRKSVDETISPHIQAIENLDPNALVGFRGSLARGRKGPHKVNVPFDPSEFDVDAFIVSDELASRYSKREWFRDGTKIPEIANAQSQIDAKLRQTHPGLKDERFTFRIFTHEEFAKKVKSDERYFID